MPTWIILLTAMLVLLPGVSSAQSVRPADAVLLARADATSVDAQPPGKPILLTERVEARDRVFARLLLGGRVMIVVREGSSLSITEVSGAATIDVERGRVAITVDRDNLDPQDLVEVRTPHAAVTVHSATLVVHVDAVSRFMSVGRHLDVFRLDPATGTALEPPMVAEADDVVTVDTAAVSVANR